MFRLRAYQLVAFVREVWVWENTGQETEELRELGGGFVRTLRRNGWVLKAGDKRHIKIDAAALLVYRAAWARDCGGRARITREAAMAKLFATDAAQEIIDDAVQIWGAAGLVSGAMTESLYREIRAMRIYEGASDVQKIVIARSLLTPS